MDFVGTATDLSMEKSPFSEFKKGIRKDADGFHWSEVDEAWQEWPKDIPKYLAGLDHPCAIRGFNRDMSNLIACEACVYVMPCGVSASLEAGWACGSGRLVIVYVPGLREPDLMVKMAHLITDKLEDVRERLLEYQPVYRQGEEK